MTDAPTPTAINEPLADREAVAQALALRFIERGKRRFNDVSWTCLADMPRSYSDDFYADADAAIAALSPVQDGPVREEGWRDVSSAPFDKMVLVACDRFGEVCEAIQYRSGRWTTFGANGAFSCRPKLWRDKPAFPALSALPQSEGKI